MSPREAAVIALHRAEPTLTNGEIARRLNIRSADVSKVTVRHGIRLPKHPMDGHSSKAEKEIRSRQSIRAEVARLAAKNRALMGHE